MGTRLMYLYLYISGVKMRESFNKLERGENLHGEEACIYLYPV